ncbi:Proteasome subunit alpha/beta [Carpediemonas membranifera]|uniref:Proteasome subunit beta n=1 Tax=Carpediemonas membranifera TaxID=201153 RepID=A0A8J6B4G8_9EUKA|nr:Proteasome subunit alpha/beta [Carpediemonas membranifera]|eukprot:KAG9389832.1 Proteasome subunit alpha/beta [Carpediemonas membranifera]
MSSQFEPYTDNGGTVIAVAGEDFVIIAGDTRLTQNSYCIASRNVSKVAKITDNIFIASAGMQADIFTLQKNLLLHSKQFKQDTGADISLSAFSQYLGNTLYGRRFFPYYTFNIVGGIKPDGTTGIFEYDAVGNFQEYKCSCAGSAASLMFPLLDSQMKGRKTPIPFDEALGLVKDAITSAGERDIHTGDFVKIHVLRRGQAPEETTFELKQD